MEVELIDYMGSDLTVVNAARVSYQKHSDELRPRDERLIKYLAEHKHWSPFSHAFLQFRIKAPIFVARQLAKHQVGLSWNEVSRRYVNSDPEMYVAEKFRGAPLVSKQGSFGYVPSQSWAKTCVDHMNNMGVTHYKKLLSLGVSPEQARMVLPQSMYTEWYWSGSLYAFSRVCNLRLDPHTQEETREIAQLISTDCNKRFPVSWNALTQM